MVKEESNGLAGSSLARRSGRYLVPWTSHSVHNPRAEETTALRKHVVERCPWCRKKIKNKDELEPIEDEMVCRTCAIYWRIVHGVPH